MSLMIQTSLNHKAQMRGHHSGMARRKSNDFLFGCEDIDEGIINFKGRNQVNELADSVDSFLPINGYLSRDVCQMSSAYIESCGLLCGKQRVKVTTNLRPKCK